MIIRMKPKASVKDISAVVRSLEAGGARVFVNRRSGRAIIGLQKSGNLTADEVSALSGVEEVQDSAQSFKLVSRDYHPEDSVIRVGSSKVGKGRFCVMAGPCSIESEEQIFSSAEYCKAAGATILRGGAFKPRTSPYSFQGLGVDGLKLLEAAGKSVGLPVVTEVLSNEHVDVVAEHADVLQIGARNMQNFKLLEAVGHAGKPVLLKRGMNATIKEFLFAAEYVAANGSIEVMLCERGIRTFETYTRNTLDIAAVPALKAQSHLPVIIDPSHASGRREMILPLSRAALAIGADGLMIETHPRPEEALSDGAQSLPPEQFTNVMNQLKEFHSLLSKKGIGYSGKRINSKVSGAIVY